MWLLNFVACSAFVLAPPRPQTRLMATSQENLEKVWLARRKMARFAFRVRERVQEEEEEVEQEDRQAATLISTALVIGVVTLVVRLGGRAALLNLAGLNIEGDAELARQIDEIVAYKTALGEVPAFVAYTLLWTVAKVGCLDPLAFLLAVSSGVVFGGVVEGAVISAACATLGSSLSFYIARASDLRPKILRLARRNVRLRSLEKAVTEKGFQTVLALRIAPVIPVPIGAYPYVYGATDMKFAKFAPAMFLGSLKPYAFDAYVGVVGRDTVTGADVADPVIFFVFAGFLVVGTVISNFATQAWDDIEKEQGLQDEYQDVNPDEDWLDVLGIRETPVFKFTTEAEPDWSRQLRTRSRRARYALASMAIEELDLAIQDRTEVLDEEPQAKTIVPAGADATFNLPGSALESFFFTIVIFRALWSYDTLHEEINDYNSRG